VEGGPRGGGGQGVGGGEDDAERVQGLLAPEPIQRRACWIPWPQRLCGEI
jgi:hypothetical protein